MNKYMTMSELRLEDRHCLTVWSVNGGSTMVFSMVFMTSFHSSFSTRFRTVFSQILANNVKLGGRKGRERETHSDAVKPLATGLLM